MNSFDRINMVLDYIEQKLCEEPDEKAVAAIAGCSFQQFQRIFSYIAGMPLHEYIRKRKLTVAAIELKHRQHSVIDIAVRYGYDTPSGVTRAFRAHHNATPTEIIHGVKEPRLFSHLFFLSPSYTGSKIYRIEKGEIKMAKLTYIEFKQLGPYKVIGRSMNTKLMSNDIAMLWGKFFSDGSFDTLMGLCEDKNNFTTLPDAYTGVMHNFKGDGKITYLVGLTFPATTQVPEGFDCFELPASIIAEAWITGEEYEIYSQGHELTVAAIEAAGHSVNWDNFYQCEVYTDERFEKPKKAGKSIVTLDYYIPVK